METNETPQTTDEVKQPIDETPQTSDVETEEIEVIDDDDETDNVESVEETPAKKDTPKKTESKKPKEISTSKNGYLMAIVLLVLTAVVGYLFYEFKRKKDESGN